MTKKIKGQDEVREKVALLLRAETPIGKIMELTGVSRATVFNTRNKMKTGTIHRSPRGPPKNKIITDEFLSDLKLSYNISPMTSQRKMAREARNVAQEQFPEALKKLDTSAKRDQNASY